MYVIETIELSGNRTMEVLPDLDPTNPRKEYDNFGTMACWHRHYELGDEQPSCRPEEYLIGLFPHEKGEDSLIMLAVYLYDHSGLALSTSPFSCPWDSGQVGYIYVKMEAARKEYAGLSDEEVRERASARLEAEVEEYSYYLSGQVYGYRVLNQDEEIVDSCWGFIGPLDEVKKYMMEYVE